MSATNVMSTDGHISTVSVRTTCPYCGVGCGVIASTSDYNTVDIKGDSEHPANFGRLCSKGAALGETLGEAGRMLYPEIQGQRVSWDQALCHVAQAFQRTLREHGPEAIAFYVSGQLLTEDYYVANKLMKGFIGSANIDTNSRLCMASSVAGHRRAFGTDTVPGNYQDLERADLLILVGSNAAWCHPVLWQRMLAARRHRPGMRIVVIDPRTTATAEGSDLHLAIQAGSDVALFNGLLVYLADSGHLALNYLATHTQGLDDALRIARAECPNAESVAERTGLNTEQVLAFFHAYGSTERVVTLYSQGVHQSSAGTDKVNAIINCHLATGRIGREGTGPFSLTGQPNAMGGREVGGLANQLAAHLEIDNAEHRAWVQGFWKSPCMAERAGLKAVEMFDAVAAGKVKAIWIIATNPAVSLPAANTVKAALSQCPLVIVSDCVADNDTLRLAHVRLPALAWLEKDGTVTNSERCISRQRALLPAPGEAKADWWMLAQVGQRMGYPEAFAYQDVSEIFAEHARLSGVNNGGVRDFDLSGWSSLTPSEYSELSPTQWPVRTTLNSSKGTERLCVDGQFYTSDRRGRLVAVSHRPPIYATSTAYPWVLNTGRVRDHWHTLTRTARSPRLTEHRAEPYLEIHPLDAQQLGLGDGALAAIRSRWGYAITRVHVHSGQQRGCVFMPMHWSSTFSTHGGAGALVNPVVDPISGQPELKHTPVDVTPFVVTWQASGIVQTELEHQPKAEYWVKVPGDALVRYILAGQATLDLVDSAALFDLLGIKLNEHDQVIRFQYLKQGRTRIALMREGRLMAALNIQPANAGLPDHRWQLWAFQGTEALTASERQAVVAGRAQRAMPAPGPTVCACFGVGEWTLRRGFEAGCNSVDALGEALKAGTNCGSCKPELARLISEWQVSEPAAAPPRTSSVPAMAAQAAAPGQMR